MAVSVLGKRARGTESTNDNGSVSSRVKRRVREPCRVNDENLDPKRLCNGKPIELDGDPMVLDENEDLCQTPCNRSTKTKTPTKAVVNNSRSALSPTKVNGSARVSIYPQKPTQLPTPQTPRHRDALSKKVPITPRHRIGLLGRPQLSPKSPRTPSSTSSTNAITVYHAARQLFMRSTEPGRLIGRDGERAELTSFVRKGIGAKNAAGQRCMYVSGPPGTGKSALVDEVCRDFVETEGTKMLYLNCMSIKSSKMMYTKIIDALLGEDTVLVKSEEETLKDLFRGNGQLGSQTTISTFIITLDEIDALVPISPEVLYNLFAWSLGPRSRLILIGIANALDLTDRFLPKLKAKNLKPQLLPFLPYTSKQIEEVVTTKLQTLNDCTERGENEKGFVPFLHPTAITFCAKKVASQTGDLRKAFDIVRRAVDVVETETKQKQLHLSQMGSMTKAPRSPLGENTNLVSPPSSQPSPPPSSTLETFTPLTAPRATIAHVAKVISATMGNGPSERLKTLNLQQKAALCALLSLQQKSALATATTPACKRGYLGSPFDNIDDFPSIPTKSRLSSSGGPASSPSTKRHMAPTLRSLHIKYTLLCTRSCAIQPLTATEFGDVIAGLETMGLVSTAKESSLLIATTKTTTTPGKSSMLVNGLTGSPMMMTPSRKGKIGTGVGNGKEEKMLVAYVERKEMEAALGEGVGGDILRGLMRDDDDDDVVW